MTNWLEECFNLNVHTYCYCLEVIRCFLIGIIEGKSFKTTLSGGLRSNGYSKNRHLCRKWRFYFHCRSRQEHTTAELSCYRVLSLCSKLSGHHFLNILNHPDELWKGRDGMNVRFLWRGKKMNILDRALHFVSSGQLMCRELLIVAC